jgi:hypothetical protein
MLPAASHAFSAATGQATLPRMIAMVWPAASFLRKPPGIVDVLFGFDRPRVNR